MSSSDVFSILVIVVWTKTRLFLQTIAVSYERNPYCCTCNIPAIVRPASTGQQAHRSLLIGWVELAADQVKLDDEVREQLDGCVREATRSF